MFVCVCELFEYIYLFICMYELYVNLNRIMIGSYITVRISVNFGPYGWGLNTVSPREHGEAIMTYWDCSNIPCNQ